MKKEKDKVFQSFLSFIRTNPMTLITAVADYYKQFDIPAPTKDDLRPFILKSVCFDEKLNEQQIIQIKNAVEFVLSSYLDD